MLKINVFKLDFVNPACIYYTVLYDSFNTAIMFGFEREIFTFFEAFNTTGDLIPLPIVISNNQRSEETFSVRISLVAGNSSNTATEGADFAPFSNPTILDFIPDEQRLNFQIILFADDTPEGEESFQIELSLTTSVPGVSVGGGGVFSRTTVVIVDDDG